MGGGGGPGERLQEAFPRPEPRRISDPDPNGSYSGVFV